MFQWSKISFLLVCILLSACSPISTELKTVSQETVESADIQASIGPQIEPTKKSVTATLPQPSPEPTQWILRESGEIHALTPKLTVNSTSHEIREKMLTSFLNWQTMEVQAVWAHYSPGSDDGVESTMNFNGQIRIDQENFRYITVAKQQNGSELTRLAVCDGETRVFRAWSKEGKEYPESIGFTSVSKVSAPVSADDAIVMLKSGEEEYPPLGKMYSDVLRPEIFSSTYAIQYSGEYEVIGMESIAGRETLKVLYDEVDRSGETLATNTLWIDTETGVVLKAWMDNTPGNLVISSEITYIAYNIPLEASLFNIDDVMPDFHLDDMQADTVDGYTIYAGNLVVEGEQVTLNICYDLPSNSHWMLYDMLLDGKEQTNIHGEGFYMEPAGTFHEKGFRCDEVIFTHAFDGDVLHFEVGQLYSVAREGDPCDVSDWVSQDLIDAGTPVEFSCVEKSGVAKTEILTWSERLTKEEARIRVEALFEEYRVETQPGPWVFEIPVNRE